MLNWLFGKKLESHLGQTKKVKVNGVKFVIKKLNALNYLDGSKVLKATYDTYKTKGNDVSGLVNDKKLVEHFSHAICSGVISPKITLEKEETGIHVDELFVDWDLVVELYNEIMTFTYGKKKLKLLSYQKKG